MTNKEELLLLRRYLNRFRFDINNSVLDNRLFLKNKLEYCSDDSKYNKLSKLYLKYFNSVMSYDVGQVIKISKKRSHIPNLIEFVNYRTNQLYEMLKQVS